MKRCITENMFCYIQYKVRGGMLLFFFFLNTGEKVSVGQFKGIEIGFINILFSNLGSNKGLKKSKIKK